MPRRARAPTVPMTVEGPKGGTPHAALSGRADVSGSPRGSCGSRGRGGLPQRHRAQRARGRHLAAFLRERGQVKDVLRLRRAQPGGDPKERRGQRPAGGRDDQGPRTGSLPILLRGQHMLTIRKPLPNFLIETHLAPGEVDEPRRALRLRAGAIAHKPLMRAAAILSGLIATLVIGPSALASVPGVNGKIAFASYGAGSYEIYAMNADGSGQVRLTSNAANDLDPTFSP